MSVVVTFFFFSSTADKIRNQESQKNTFIALLFLWKIIVKYKKGFMDKVRCITNIDSSSAVGAIVLRINKPSDSFLIPLIFFQPLDRLTPWLPFFVSVFPSNTEKSPTTKPAKESSSDMKTSRTRGKSPGWAAFALKQQKQSPETEVDNDPYPPIPSNLTSLRNCEYIRRNTDFSVRPFSSVLSVDFQTSKENKNGQNPIPSDNSNSRGKNENTDIEENNHDLALKNLKMLHSWADNSLIEDIMSAVDNSIEKASTILEGMVPSSSSRETKETKVAELSSTVRYFPCDKKTDERFLVKKTLDLASENSAKGKYRELTDVNASYEKKLSQLAIVNVSFGEKLSDNAADMKSILEHLCYIPVEPEWEEDDLYLSLRKDALKMMRSASQHSKSANNAFLRGDHFSANQHSLKAREEWLIADRLNSKAAKEILSIRNSENDMWTLDLHGLHAAEAVQALQERLQKIEMQGPMNRSVSPNKVKVKKGMIHTSSVESFSCIDMEDVDKQRPSFRQIQTPLQVITGIGKHSRGQASLPTAVRSFLSENGYRFEEPRKGVISVRPKIRHK